MGELPLQASSASLRQMTKPSPGTPSMHLLDEAASASKRTSRASSASAPKALMESISRRRPALGDDRGDLGDRIEDARGGLAMDDEDMGDGGVGGQRRFHLPPDRPADPRPIPASRRRGL